MGSHTQGDALGWLVPALQAGRWEGAPTTKERWTSGTPEADFRRIGVRPSRLLFSPHCFLTRYTPLMDTIGWEDFAKVELRVGRIVEAREFPEARKPAYVLHVDFGPEIGVRKSSAQITDLYTPESLIGKLVVAVVNFPKKQIGPLQSECLVTGFHDAEGRVALCVPDQPVPVGTKLL